MRAVRLSVTLQHTSSGYAARVTREDSAEGYGYNATYREPMDAISFAAGTVMRELSEGLKDQA
jgi:hypothetical protein